MWPSRSSETTHRAPKARRRGDGSKPRRWMRAVVGAGKILLAVVGVGCLALLGYHAYLFGTSSFFELKKVVIAGVSDNVASEIRALTRLEPRRRIPLLFLRESRIRGTVLKHPRIESADVTKVLPNAVIIHATERQPAAIVAAGALHLIDQEAYVLDTLTSLNKAPRRFPFVTGIEADRIALGRQIPGRPVCRALDLFECLRRTNAELAEMVSEARIGRDEGLTLILTGGLEVRLGTADFRDTLPSLDLFYRTFPHLDSVEYIDLRFRDQIIYRLRSEGQAGASPAGERTWALSQARREL